MGVTPAETVAPLPSGSLWTQTPQAAATACSSMKFSLCPLVEVFPLGDQDPCRACEDGKLGFPTGVTGNNWKWFVPLGSQTRVVLSCSDFYKFHRYLNLSSNPTWDTVT